MKKTVLSVAKAHRNPVGVKVCTGRDFAKALRKFDLPTDGRPGVMI
jgi:hypothetical protein